MTKYEYTTTGEIGLHNFLVKLNDLGQQGWHIVHYEAVRNDLTGWHHTAIMERAVEQVEVGVIEPALLTPNAFITTQFVKTVRDELDDLLEELDKRAPGASTVEPGVTLYVNETLKAMNDAPICAECGAIPADTQRPDTGDWFCEKCWPHQEDEVEPPWPGATWKDFKCSECSEFVDAVHSNDGKPYCEKCLSAAVKRSTSLGPLCAVCNKDRSIAFKRGIGYVCASCDSHLA